MNGPEHYSTAEVFLMRAEKEYSEYGRGANKCAPVLAQIAQVHATLALAAAAAMGTAAPDDLPWWEAIS